MTLSSDAEVLRVMLLSNFEALPASILSDIDGRGNAEKVDRLNQTLAKIGYRIHLFRKKNAAFLVLQDAGCQDAEAAAQASAQQVKAEMIAQPSAADSPRAASPDIAAVPSELSTVIRKSKKPSTAFERAYKTLRVFLFQSRMEAERAVLVDMLVKNSNPFEASTEQDLKQAWEDHIQAFIDHGMLCQRDYNGTAMVSDIGADSFLSFEQVSQFVISKGIQIDVEEYAKYRESLRQVYGMK